MSDFRAFLTGLFGDGPTTATAEPPAPDAEPSTPAVPTGGLGPVLVTGPVAAEAAPSQELSARDPEHWRIHWRAQLAPSELALFPADPEPPADMLAQVLTARRLFGGEVVSVRAGIEPRELSPEWREWYEERAAIREYDGGQLRDEAERAALGEVLAAMKAAGVCAETETGFALV
jgi:hypothetical protein